MNKQILVQKVSKCCHISQRQSEEILDCAFKTIMDTVAGGEKVQIVNFGTFESRRRAARTGHNPRTNEEIKIPSASLPAFKSGKKFKLMVNK